VSKWALFRLALRTFSIQFLLSIDQLANTVIWVSGDGFGMADETISARAWRLRMQSSAYKFIDALFFWQTGHCQSAYESEMRRKHLPNAYRDGVIR
jgi:hypothetical protein